MDGICEGLVLVEGGEGGGGGGGEEEERVFGFGLEEVEALWGGWVDGWVGKLRAVMEEEEERGVGGWVGG